MTLLPFLLIYARLAMGPILIGLSLLHINHYPFFAISLLTLGLLTDIFDGIIARKWNCSSPKLRRLDSTVDQVFFISVAIATYLQCPSFFHANGGILITLFAFEGLTYTVCYLKFRKEIATHSLGAKIWTLILFATLIEIIATCQSGMLFELCCWIGIATRIEIIAIILTLKTWTTDVPSIYHAIRLRKGKAIKRHKLLNG